MLRGEKAFAMEPNSAEVISEPHACSPFRNMLLYYPSTSSLTFYFFFDV